ncbi:MAG: COG4315 family predicted lipoprotein [Solirubrobacteraceae bacterium]
MKHLRLAAALVSAVALATAATALGHTAHAAGASVTVKTKHTSLGTFLVNSSGKTLYLDQGDKPPHFACLGGCLKAWPPLKATGTLKAAGAAKQSDLGTVKGPGGKMVTYKGHPLYTFVSDTSANPTSGEGVNGFFVVSPSGSKITKHSTTTTTTTSSSTGGGYGY